MTDPRLTRLTNSERDALRALYRYRTLNTAGPSLGITASGIKARLEAAHKKTGMGRQDMVTALGKAEGWLDPEGLPVGMNHDNPPPSSSPADGCSLDLGLDEQLPDWGWQTDGARQSAGVDPTFGEARTVFDDQPVSPPIVSFPRLTRNGADGNGLSAGHRITAILLWCLIGIGIFCLLIATMSVLGNLGLNLQTHGLRRL